MNRLQKPAQPLVATRCVCALQAEAVEPVPNTHTACALAPTHNNQAQENFESNTGKYHLFITFFHIKLHPNPFKNALGSSENKSLKQTGIHYETRWKFEEMIGVKNK